MISHMFFFILAFEYPRGSLPEYWEKYNQSIDLRNQTFKCFDNSKIIPLSRLNDNYLDCPDGSDEPGTALSQHHFYCQNNGYFPTLIDSWSVGDGICDCCDGSDEIGNPDSNCENTCSQLSQDQNLIIQKILRSYYIPGAKKYQQLRAKGLRIYNAIRTEQNKIQDKILNLSQTLTNLEKKYSDIIDTQASNNNNNENNSDNHNDNNNANNKIQSSSSNSSNSTSKRKPVDQQLSERLYLLWQFTFGVEPKNMSLIERVLESQRYGIQSQIDKLQKDLQKSKKKLPSFIFDVENENHDESNENATDIAFLSLFGQYSSFNQYNYSFLGPLYQNSIVIGYTKQIGEKNEFEHGDYCNAIHMGRILEMDFICGIENRLINVEEKSICNYHAIMMTPASCSPKNTDKNVLAKLDKEALLSLLDLLSGK